MNEPEIKPGDKIALFVSNFDPPTMDHVRAAEALAAYSGISRVWICPASADNDSHARNMSSILCSDLTANGKSVSLCTVGLDKKLNAAEALAWVRSKFKYLRFQPAVVSPEAVLPGEETIQVLFGPGKAIQEGTTGIVLDKFLPVVPDLKARVAAGMDESRSFPSPIWDYIQKNRIYRNG